MSRAPLIAVLALVAVGSVFAALSFGSFPISPLQVFDSVFFPLPGIVDDVVWKLRLPRVLAAFACGGLLATAGVLLQVLLRNPLADPYILGISGGAALGALTAVLLGAGVAGGNFAALLGALGAIAIVFALSYRAGDWNLHRLLLTGVVLSAGFTALISLLLTLAPQAQLRGLLFWLMGDLSHAGGSGAAWLVLAVVLLVFTAMSGSLNALALGAMKARALGVAVGGVQAAIYFGAAAATVAAVLLGGSIGFIGIMVPHALRLAGVSDHRWLLPASALVGGSFVTLADTFARTVWAPQQLPVGVFTALLGVPVLLFSVVAPVMTLRAGGLTISIGARTLCRDLDFAMAPGELWGVLGCNGSGKTTLLHALSGLTSAAAGSVSVDGRPLADYSRRELGRTLGILLQREDQEFWGTLRDYVMLGRYPHARALFGWDAKDEAAAGRALAAFDLTALAGQAYGTLSGGERQRARLAQLWAQAPSILLLDEPLQHLDLRHQLQTLELLRAATRNDGAAAALVLHDLTFAARCDRILMLFGDGRYAAGSTAEMLQPGQLAGLYGCGIRAFGEGADIHFIPVI